MIHFGIDVGIETIFVRCQQVPGGGRHLLHQADGDDALDALEAVLPGHHQPDGRPVLGGQGLAVEPHRQEGERVHRLVEAQALHIGVIDAAAEGAGGLSRQLLGIIEGLERHELGATVGLGPADQIRQRDAAPGQHHGPGLHAAQPVDPLLQGTLVDEIPHIQGKGVGHLPLDLERPGLGLEVMAIAGRIPLVGAELIEVVVAGRLLQRRQGQSVLPGRSLVIEWFGGRCRGRLLGGEEIQQAGLGGKRQGGGTQSQPFQNESAILIDGFRRDILFGEVMRGTALDQHGKLPGR
ncbi:hypothetical protein D3C85_993450 [compost metagenome]